MNILSTASRPQLPLSPELKPTFADSRKHVTHTDEHHPSLQADNHVIALVAADSPSGCPGSADPTEGTRLPEEYEDLFQFLPSSTLQWVLSQAPHHVLAHGADLPDKLPFSPLIAYDPEGFAAYGFVQHAFERSGRPSSGHSTEIIDVRIEPPSHEPESVVSSGHNAADLPPVFPLAFERTTGLRKKATPVQSKPEPEPKRRRTDPLPSTRDDMLPRDVLDLLNAALWKHSATSFLISKLRGAISLEEMACLVRPLKRCVADPLLVWAEKHQSTDRLASQMMATLFALTAHLPGRQCKVWLPDVLPPVWLPEVEHWRRDCLISRFGSINVTRERAAFNKLLFERYMTPEEKLAWGMGCPPFNFQGVAKFLQNAGV
ncbi:hypothetical protein [Variovorax sp. KK3]|uniref:hypothetical protein n=1 Tax=Variovorax sp. KK3 TaxID=1855728 RepID=UPI00097C1485|nr:hypothetical protein [Variovorax sp. KK3]